MRKCFIESVLLISIMSSIFGCASTKEPKFAGADKSYERALEIQKRKAESVQQELESQKLHSIDNNPLVLEHLGDAYVKQGNNVLAFIQYSKALQMRPDQILLRQKMADLMLRQGMLLEALKEYDIILERAPERTDALHGKATALLRLNRFKEAETIAMRMLAIDARSWQTHALLGLIYDRQKQNVPAIDAYRKALAINPEAGTIYNNLGLTLYSNSQYRESADALLKAITLNAGSPKTYSNLGLALFRIGLTDEALEAFRKAGGDAEAYNAMGSLYMEKQDYVRAVNYFEKAIDAQPAYYKSAQEGLVRARKALQAAARSASILQNDK